MFKGTLGRTGTRVGFAISLAILALAAGTAVRTGVALAQDGVEAVDQEFTLTSELMTENDSGAAVDLDTEAVTSAADAGGDAPDGLNDRIWVDNGCGGTYQVGAPIRIYMQVDVSNYYYLKVSSSLGTKTFGPLALYAGFTHYMNGTVGGPNGLHTVTLVGGNTNVSCNFNGGTPGIPQPPAPPTGGVVIDALYTANDYLQPRTCFTPGSRVYFAARIRNASDQPRGFGLAMMSQGVLSNWWAERIEYVQLAAGETRTIYSFADGYPARPFQYKYRVLLADGPVTLADQSTTFKIGSCP